MFITITFFNDFQISRMSANDAIVYIDTVCQDIDPVPIVSITPIILYNSMASCI